MPLRFVLDENLRGGGLWPAIQKHNAGGVYPVDALRVGDPADLPRGTLDPDVLLWAEQQDRLLLSRDKSSLPGHLGQHLKKGHHSPGVLVIRARIRIADVVDFLVVVAHASDAAAWENRVEYIP